MKRVLKVAVWAAVFLGAAGIGATIAANTELFPPEVEGAVSAGPSAPATSSGPAPAPADPVWKGTIASRSYHDLYVGGRCSTDWITKLSFDALDNGRIVGTGTARLEGDRECTFPNAQVNAERIEVSVEGRWDEGGFTIRLNDGTRSPVGTADLGGFAPTVFDDGPAAVMVVALDSDTAASATVRMDRVDDQGRGRYVSVNRVALRQIV